jgi:hypothetical protein
VGKGAKIAIGCVVVVFLGIAAVLVGLGGLAWWGKNKLEKITAGETKIQEAQKKANAVKFTPPADGVIAEGRLTTFIDVRKRVYAVYEKHKDEIEAMKAKKQGDLSDLSAAYGLITELRQAQAEALADLGMSTDEYQFMVTNVYKTMWASEVAKSTGGKSVSEATGEAYSKMAEALKASGATTPEARKTLEEMEAQAKTAQEGASQMDVPAANIDLFRRHEEEIKKYAMGGLELLGL